MCGIVGYIGHRDALSVLCTGLLGDGGPNGAPDHTCQEDPRHRAFDQLALAGRGPQRDRG